ncbi:MAG: exodeoxyribonuclease VII large subunit [Lentisphaeraceae bacterium]|nr:exodeoxyribonuclease VII large subunit [Lentisphaeraceae bacterium]
MEQEPKVWKVSELTFAVKDLLEDAFFPFWLGGEIGNLTVHRSGHVYFTLKDAKSQISCVYFSGSRAVQQQQIREGTEVELYGNLTVYAARGSYQINVQKMRPKGIGGLMAQFEELKNKLYQEGLFDESRKKKIPLLPKTIAVVTSSEGAALHDFLNVVHRRYSNTHIRIFPCAVQGKNSAPEIAAQIKYCNEIAGADVIIVTRGGGSLEDLWSFNEEIVARAVADSQIPIISAVGHEVDFTICDFVADLRVPTPAAAAELVIGQKEHYEEQLVNLKRRLSVNLQLKLTRMKQKLQLLANAYVLKDPLRPLSDKKQLLDEYQKRIELRLERVIEQYRHKLANLQTKIDMLNPQHVLDRGYSIVSYKGKVQFKANEIPDKEEFEVRLAEGTLTAVKVEEKK